MQLRPEFVRNSLFEPFDICGKLLRIARAGYDRDRSRMPERKLQRSRLQRNTKVVTNALKRIHPRDDVGRRIGIVEFAVACQNT